MNTPSDNNSSKAFSLLKEDEKKILLKIARETIQSHVSGKRPPSFDISSPVLKEKRGAFVTIHKRGMLRGCIGYIEAFKPLYETITEMAIAAATQDPRFPPLSQEEIKDIDIEISVLTPLAKINNPEEIEVGKHGIVVSKGFYSGLLLPQVATEYGWDRITFLEHTCQKAGLSQNAWKGDVEIYIFSADVFGEKKRG